MDLDVDQQERYISIWAKAVETQMHFNEMSVKSRQLGLTFVAAALGVAVVLIGRGDDFALPVNLGFFKLQIHVGVILTLGAWLALTAVRGLDLDVYHKMLRGAVTFGEDFEENYMKKIFQLEKGMTQAISHYSRYSNAKATLSDGKYTYTGDVKVTAEDKIRDFYKRTIHFLWGASIALFFITNIGFWIESYSDTPGKANEAESQSPPAEASEQSNE